MMVISHLAATVVETVDSDELPIFAIPTLNSHREYNSLEKAMQAVQDMLPDKKLAWIHNEDAECWNAYVLEATNGKMITRLRPVRTEKAF